MDDISYIFMMFSKFALNITTRLFLVAFVFIAISAGLKTHRPAMAQMQVVCTSMGEAMLMMVETEVGGPVATKDCQECLFCALNPAQAMTESDAVPFDAVVGHQVLAWLRVPTHRSDDIHATPRGPPFLS